MTQLTTVLRWTARIGSLATLSLVLLAAGSQLSGNADPPRFHEWIGLGLFPAGVCAGLVVAFFRERQGGLISIASLVGFYLWHLTVSGTLPTGPYFAILTSPALLWLLSAQLSESVKPVQGAACGKENVHDGHASERPNSTPPSVFTNDSTATKTDDRLLGRTAIVVASVHHENTLKVAGVIAEALDAVLFTLEQAKAADLSEFDLVGFGSGIYFGQHHSALRKLVHCLDAVPQNVFVFSTAGLPFLSPCFHWRLKQALRTRGCRILDEFSCRGWDTVGPLFFIGGLNRHHPDTNDLNHATTFAHDMAQHMSPSRMRWPDASPSAE